MPLLSMVSVGMAGQAGAPAPSSQSSDDKKQSSGNPITSGIGGIFGRKKKKDDAAQQDNGSASSSATPAGTPGSLMDTTMEVTSVSTSAVDASLFQVPEGYKQIQAKGAQ
jgi:hypothetical protein